MPRPNKPRRIIFISHAQFRYRNEFLPPPLPLQNHETIACQNAQNQSLSLPPKLEVLPPILFLHSTSFHDRLQSNSSNGASKAQDSQAKLDVRGRSGIGEAGRSDLGARRGS